MKKNGILSYCFRDAGGKIIESKNEKYPMLPASNMKIVSGYTAYKLLGRDYKFSTYFSMEGDSLLVHGDPSLGLSREKLANLIQQAGLKGKNIKRILFKDGIFDGKEFADGWNIEDNGNCYQTRIVPFSVDEGCYCGEGDCKSGKPLHDVAKLSVKNQLSNFAIEVAKAMGVSPDISVSSTIDKNDDHVAQHSEKLVDILDHIETYSCNFSIEVLTKYLSHVINGGKGTWKESSVIITDFMKSLGLDTNGIMVVDGSGLSRLNLMSTEFLSDLVYRIVKNGDIGFINLLPSPGSGTLRGRLSEIENLNLHAKTGSLEYCGSLTGYIEKAGIFFSIIINNSLEDGRGIIREIDDLLVSFLNRNGFAGKD